MNKRLICGLRFDLIDKEICIMKYTCVTVPPGAVAVPLKLKLKD